MTIRFYFSTTLIGNDENACIIPLSLLDALPIEQKIDVEVCKIHFHEPVIGEGQEINNISIPSTLTRYSMEFATFQLVNENSDDMALYIKLQSMQQYRYTYFTWWVDGIYQYISEPSFSQYLGQDKGMRISLKPFNYVDNDVTPSEQAKGLKPTKELGMSATSYYNLPLRELA